MCACVTLYYKCLTLALIYNVYLRKLGSTVWNFLQHEVHVIPQHESNMNS